MQEGSIFSTLSLVFIVCRHFDDGHSDQCEMISHYNFDLHFSGPITSWEIDGETVEAVSDFIFGGSQITADGDCSHETKRHMYPIVHCSTIYNS